MTEPPNNDAIIIQSTSKLDIKEELPSHTEKKNGDDGEYSRTENYYTGDMERFFQSEVKPVYFGGKNDAFLMLKTTLIALILVNLFGIFVYMKSDVLTDHPPTPVARHHGAHRLLEALEYAAAAYYNDGQVVVGWLLSCWFLGFNVISGMIWWQFERREIRHPDDFEIIINSRIRKRSTTPASSTNNHHMQETGKSSGIPDSLNPFDKSIIVISMPNGDFSVAKRQKPQF